MPVNFLIKHRSGGQFFHPSGGNSNPGNETAIVLHGDIHKNMFWTFEKVQDHWGYIKHVSSDNIIQPRGGDLNPCNDTKLVLHIDRHHGALFAFDQANGHVIHIGGKYAHPYGGSPNPGNDTQVVLHQHIHDAMRFQFVATDDPNKEILRMPVNFLIKHRSSGQFFHPSGGNSNPGNETAVVLHGDIHKNMFWTIEKVQDHWGYIKHVSSGKVIQPRGGNLNPGNDTKLVLRSDRHHGALFALDQANGHVIHICEKYAHPYGGSPNPGNDTQVVLHQHVHDAMRFQFVATDDPNKEVMVYGSPTLVGK